MSHLLKMAILLLIFNPHLLSNLELILLLYTLFNLISVSISISFQTLFTRITSTLITRSPISLYSSLHPNNLHFEV